MLYNMEKICMYNWHSEKYCWKQISINWRLHLNVIPCNFNIFALVLYFVNGLYFYDNLYRKAWNLNTKKVLNKMEERFFLYLYCTIFLLEIDVTKFTVWFGFKYELSKISLFDLVLWQEFYSTQCLTTVNQRFLY